MEGRIRERVLPSECRALGTNDAGEARKFRQRGAQVAAGERRRWIRRRVRDADPKKRLDTMQSIEHDERPKLAQKVFRPRKRAGASRLPTSSLSELSCDRRWKGIQRKSNRQVQESRGPEGGLAPLLVAQHIFCVPAPLLTPSSFCFSTFVQALLLLLEFGSELGRRVLGLKQLTNFDLRPLSGTDWGNA